MDERNVNKGDRAGRESRKDALFTSEEAVAFDREVVARSDAEIMKVSGPHAPEGKWGLKHLASGKSLAMRMWDNEAPTDKKPESRRDYETVGYVLKGRAELHLEGQTVLIEPGDSWVVPRGAAHTYRILEPFTAVEATSPPSQEHGREQGLDA